MPLQVLGLPHRRRKGCGLSRAGKVAQFTAGCDLALTESVDHLQNTREAGRTLCTDVHPQQRLALADAFVMRLYRREVQEVQ